MHKYIYEHIAFLKSTLEMPGSKNHSCGLQGV